MSPELSKLLAEAKARVDAMTPEEREEMYEEQRRSFMRSVRSCLAGERETRVMVLPADYVRTIAKGYSAAPEPDYKAILLALCAGSYLNEHMGDASEDIWRALKLAGINPPEDVDDDAAMADWLAREHGAESLWSLEAPGEK